MTISITVTTPAGLTVAQMVQTLCTAWGYQQVLDDGRPNPQTQGQFVQARVARFLRDSYVAARSDLDAQAARDSAAAAAAAVTVT